MFATTIVSMYQLRAFANLLLLAASLQNASASPQAPMQFSTFEPCRGSAAFCGTRILARGVIQEDTHLRLKQFLARQGIAGGVMVFDSPGGNVGGAMELGRLIRQMGISTAMQLNVEGERRVGGADGGTEMFTLAAKAQCASACTLAFLGGIAREVEADARVGVHQFYATSGSIGDGATQVTMTLIAHYVEQMGVDRRLLDFASAAPPGGMYWISAAQARALRVDTTKPALAEWRIETDQAGEPSVNVRQRLDGGRELMLGFINSPRGVDVKLMLRLSERAGSNRLEQFPVDEPLTIAFKSGARTVAIASPLHPWKRLATLPDGSVAFAGMVTIRPADLARLGAATQLALDHDVPQVYSDFGASTELSTEGLSGAVKLLLRTTQR